MDTLTLSELIEQCINSVRWIYTEKNEYDLQEFHSYLKLSNGIIIPIPQYDNEAFLKLNIENIDYFQKHYGNAQELKGDSKTKIEGHKIEDIYFCYYNGEIDNDKKAYIKLKNGLYFTENNFGPVGVTNVDLIIYNQKEFDKEINSIKAYKGHVKSYIGEIKNVC
jgi:hypothetical protein